MNAWPSFRGQPIALFNFSLTYAMLATDSGMCVRTPSEYIDLGGHFKTINFRVNVYFVDLHGLNHAYKMQVLVVIYSHKGLGFKVHYVH